MKYFFIGVFLFLVSCSDTSTEVENPTKETTLELQQLAKADTVVYKVVELNSTLYIVDTKDYVVVKKMTNYSGLVDTLFLACLGLSLSILILNIILKD